MTLICFLLQNPEADLGGGAGGARPPFFVSFLFFIAIPIVIMFLS